MSDTDALGCIPPLSQTCRHYDARACMATATDWRWRQAAHIRAKSGAAVNTTLAAICPIALGMHSKQRLLCEAVAAI